jgi:hypothetical protein
MIAATLEAAVSWSSVPEKTSARGLTRLAVLVLRALQGLWRALWRALSRKPGALCPETEGEG